VNPSRRFEAEYDQEAEEIAHMIQRLRGHMTGQEYQETLELLQMHIAAFLRNTSR
jgi:hypothetical protein